MSDKIAFLEYEQKLGGIMDIAESHPPKGAPLQPEMGLTSLFKRVNQQHFRYDFGRMATIRVLLFDSNFGNTTGLGERVVPRLRERAPCGQREPGDGIHAT